MPRITQPSPAAVETSLAAVGGQSSQCCGAHREIPLFARRRRLLGCTAGADAKDSRARLGGQDLLTSRQPDFLRPWTKQSPRESSGTGVIIDGKRILTNAHMVNYASQVYVQADQSTDRIPAKVMAIAPPSTWPWCRSTIRRFSTASPLPLADDIPALKQTVNVYGYPMGGEQLSVTQGVVSRIEYRPHFRVYECLADSDRRRHQSGQQRRPRRERRQDRRPGLQQVHRRREHRLLAGGRGSPLVSQGCPERFLPRETSVWVHTGRRRTRRCAPSWG